MIHSRFVRSWLPGWASLVGLICLGACARPVGLYRLTTHYADFTPPPAPDYSRPEHWAALPNCHDWADSIPRRSPASVRDGQATATADVFFVHPTTYTYQPRPGSTSDWNAAVDDAYLNQRTDASTVLNQATIFNGSGRVYAPRYRQAHYHAFVTGDPADKRQSLDLAYGDVRAAFQYYLTHYNAGSDGRPRPIIIASHSQGTVHATRLIAEFFDGKPLQTQLVAAYLIGIATPPDRFRHVLPGESPTQTGCFVSWNTFARQYVPTYYANGLNRALCTNPLTWSSAPGRVPRSHNVGGVGLKYRFKKRLSDAEVHNGLLWVGKPRIFGVFLTRTKIWHRADLNFFWLNTRQNVADRLRAFERQQATR